MQQSKPLGIQAETIIDLSEVTLQFHNSELTNSELESFLFPIRSNLEKFNFKALLAETRFMQAYQLLLNKARLTRHSSYIKRDIIK